MNRLLTHPGACIEIAMSDIDREALTKVDGKTKIVVYVVPRANLPRGATHAVYQAIRGRKGEEHPRIGTAILYTTEHVPAELQTEFTL
jgi:hypothetical protein